MSLKEAEARRIIVEVGRLLYERGYVVSSDGNLSIRLDENLVLATPTMTCKGRMTAEMLALTDLNGNPINDKKPSSELAMHLLIYKKRPDVRAVCHAHPPYGTAFAVAGLSIDKPILSEVILTLGCVPLTAYGTPSTEELTKAIEPFVEHHNALLMQNHGAVAYGKDLWQAFDRLETLEHTAKIAILAKILGGAQHLPKDAIEKLINIREKAGYLTKEARNQVCRYLNNDSQHREAQMNGKKFSFTREELIELLSQVVGLS